MNVDSSFFSGPGLLSEQSTNTEAFTEENNAWCVVSGVNSNTADGMPVLFTRNLGVLDTSAVMRLYLPDGPLPSGLEAFLHGVERGVNQAVAPELLLAEVGTVANKKRIQGILNLDETVELIRLVHSMPIRYFSHLDLLEPSLALAVEHELTVYEALCAAAVRLGLLP